MSCYYYVRVELNLYLTRLPSNAAPKDNCTHEGKVNQGTFEDKQSSPTSLSNRSVRLLAYSPEQKHGIEPVVDS
jgi:hypothetical protein